MQKKREKELKAKSTQIVVKEIRFGPQTDEHDYEFKRKNAEKFLKEGSKLKAFVFFKGRSIIYKEQGQILIIKIGSRLRRIWKSRSIARSRRKKNDYVHCSEEEKIKKVIYLREIKS
jgi:translation initiation factor IF-3